jgi:CheY-like chemotaxis protein
LQGSLLADFTADVAFSDREESSRRMRVMLREDRLAVATDELTRSIPTADVFDIVQDISPRATPDATETVRIGFRAGGVREVASVRTEAESLLRFQHTLFGALLDGTAVVVRHTAGGDRALPASELALSVTAAEARFERDDGSVAVAVPRDRLSGFETGQGSLGDGGQPVVTLYWVDGGRPVRTAVCLPTPRLFNLFGRYVRSTAALESDEPPAPETPIEVLFVDDDPDDLEMAELFLKRQSDRLSITRRTSAAGGLDYVVENDPDCVVSDFAMPGTDGVEFLRAVRERRPDLPFILFTGQGTESVAKRAIVDDVTDYVEKGIGTNQYAVLARRIHEAVDRSR